ncbi:MAG: hypothetical protein PHV78_00475 [Patescibacteria group bacterium]|nr:hypothetical protein [Patescibacteria group bacterium]MDD5121353.1 hypothetical protein [Patescibacteria group bacterium]MDD5395728.1 hypothetical protein [Patescibacteria group bacterium]
MNLSGDHPFCGFFAVQAAVNERFDSINFFYHLPVLPSDDYVRAAVMLPNDSNIMVAGENRPVDSVTRKELGMSNLLLMKINCHAVPIWRRTYSLARKDSVRSMRRLTNGDFIVVGTVADTNEMHAWDISVTRLDTAGELLWSRTYGNPDSADDAADVEQLDDTIALVVAKTSRYDEGRFWFMAVDLRNGDTLWTKSYFSYGNPSVLYRLKKWASGHVVIAVGQGGGAFGHGLVVAFDYANQDTLWTFHGSDSFLPSFCLRDWIARGDTIIAVGRRHKVAHHLGYGVRLVVPAMGIEESSTLIHAGKPLVVKPTIGREFRFLTSVNSVKIYNSTGRCVRHVAGRESGRLWDGRDDGGFAAPNGVYEARTSDGSPPVRLVLIR